MSSTKSEMFEASRRQALEAADERAVYAEIWVESQPTDSAEFTDQLHEQLDEVAAAEAETVEGADGDAVGPEDWDEDDTEPQIDPEDAPVVDATE